MRTVLAIGAAGMWTSFLDYAYLIRVRLMAMLSDLDAIDFVIVAVAGLILWGVTGRRR